MIFSRPKQPSSALRSPKSLGGLASVCGVALTAGLSGCAGESYDDPVDANAGASSAPAAGFATDFAAMAGASGAPLGAGAGSDAAAVPQAGGVAAAGTGAAVSSVAGAGSQPVAGAGTLPVAGAAAGGAAVPAAGGAALPIAGAGGDLAAGAGGDLAAGAGGDLAAGAGGDPAAGAGGDLAAGAGGDPAAGAGGDLAAGAGGDPEATTSCNVDVSAALAAIKTVGEVTFSTDLAGMTSAEVEFGKTTDYGMVAPADLDAPDNRTLLLGMVQSTTYNFRVKVSNGSEVCYSDNQTLETGTLSQQKLASASTGAGAAPGFIVTSRGSDAIIFNKDGELVWAYTFGGGLFRARMSWDGKYVLARDVGPFNSGSSGTIYRVAIDGTGATTFDVPGGDHHDLTPVPRGFAYMAKTAAGECDHIYTVDIDGKNQQEVVYLGDVYDHFQDVSAQQEKCHCNFIRYSSEGDFYTVSDREKDTLAFINGDGSVITSLGAAPIDNWAQHIQAEGTGSTWRVQHGHHWYADDKLLVFTNGPFGGGTSKMLHYTISGSNATLDWQYTAAGNSGTQGDVMALPNGNFLVTASNAGTIHEVDANQKLISTYSAGGGGGGGPGGGGGGGFGYAFHRPTLYGAPPGR